MSKIETVETPLNRYERDLLTREEASRAIGEYVDRICESLRADRTGIQSIDNTTRRLSRPC